LGGNIPWNVGGAHELIGRRIRGLVGEFARYSCDRSQCAVFAQRQAAIDQSGKGGYGMSDLRRTAAGEHCRKRTHIGRKGKIVEKNRAVCSLPLLELKSHFAGKLWAGFQGDSGVLPVTVSEPLPDLFAVDQDRKVISGNKVTQS